MKTLHLWLQIMNGFRKLARCKPYGMVLSRLMTKLLYGVVPTDPVTFVTFASLLTGVALTATFIPARGGYSRRSDGFFALRVGSKYAHLLRCNLPQRFSAN